MKKELYVGLLTASILAMSGCGSSSSDGGGTTTLSAQFIDSAVAGLSYDCQSSGKTGITDSQGTFNYVAGDTCTFKVGTVTLGSAKPSGSILTPRDLSEDPVKVSNMLRLLQTLDTNGDATDGITLPTDVTGSVDLGVNFDAEINTFLAENNISNAVVTANDAEAHFEASTTVTLSDAMFIGKTYTFTSTGTGNVIVDFYSDHTLKMNGDGSVDEILSWAIVNNKLTLSDNSTVTFYLDATAKVIADNTTIVSYAVTDTPVPVVTTITLTNTMFSDKIYTYNTNPVVTVNYASDGTFTGTGDGDSSGTWTITDNKLVMTDSIGTTTISFVSETIFHATAEDIGQAANEFEGSYSVSNAIVDPTLTTEKEQTLQALRASIDTSISTESILSVSGIFGTYGYTYTDYDTNKTLAEVFMYKELVSNNAFVNYDYNATSDAFELVDYSYTDTSADIRLQDGVWVSKTYDEWATDDSLTFDANGNFVESDFTGTTTFTANAYNASGLNISHIYQDMFGQNIVSDTVFSTGAKVYEFNIVTTTFQPNYTLDYWEQGCAGAGCEAIEGNANFEGHYEQQTFSTFDEFIAYYNNSTDRFLTYYINHEIGDLTFIDNTNVEFTNAYTGVILYGTYSVETVDGTDVIVPLFTEETDEIECFSLSNGEVHNSRIDQALSSLSIDNAVQYSILVPYSSITEFITNNSISSQYSDNLYFGTDNGSYIGLFAPGNTVALFDANDNSPLDVNGSYEIVTVGSTEILVLTLPDIVTSSSMLNSQKYIYSMQDGKLRRGTYNYASNNNNEPFYFYNEIGARDIYNLIKSQATTPSSSLAPARTVSVKETQTLDARTQQEILKMKQALRKFH